MDHLATAISNRPHENAGGDIESVNRAAVGVVRDQDRVAEWAKVLRCYRETPRLVQGPALRQTPHVGSVFVKDVNKTARSPGCAGKCNIEQTIVVLDAQRL